MNSLMRFHKPDRLRIPLLAVAWLFLGTACKQTPPRDSHSFDPALIEEQQRRIAAFDSVVSTVNTDSAYRLWQWTLTLPDAKIGQQQVECEYGRLMFRYGVAGYQAIRRMEDTVWRHADAASVQRMHRGLAGMSLPVNRSVCGPPPDREAAAWLRQWTVYPLPQLPPSATDSAPRH